MTFKPFEASIPLRDGTTGVFTGEQLNGLAWYEIPAIKNSIGQVKDPARYRPIHISTGLLVGPDWHTKTAAREFIKQLSPLTDWPNLDPKAGGVTKELYDSMVKIRESIKEGKGK